MDPAERMKAKAAEGMRMAVAAMTVANLHDGEWLTDDELTMAHDWAREAGPFAAAVSTAHLAHALVKVMRSAGMDADAFILHQGELVIEAERRGIL